MQKNNISRHLRHRVLQNYFVISEIYPKYLVEEKPQEWSFAMHIKRTFSPRKLIYPRCLVQQKPLMPDDNEYCANGKFFWQEIESYATEFLNNLEAQENVPYGESAVTLFHNYPAELLYANAPANARGFVRKQRKELFKSLAALVSADIEKAVKTRQRSFKFKGKIHKLKSLLE